VKRIGNGVDVRGRFNPETIPERARGALRYAFDLDATEPVVAMIGRLVREKGYFEFFEAAAKLREEDPGIRFLCIGDTVTSEHDDAKAAILERVEALGLRDAVRFAGLRSDIPELLSLCTVYCLPSWREGMPRSIIEAMALEKPVVATRIRGCREEVVDGETGFLVPVRDAEALAGALGYLLRHPLVARQFGKAGRQRALRLYDERKVLERQWRVLTRLTKRG
jgi:glycosyltransferase involved in cell wall biosynthesis